MKFGYVKADGTPVVTNSLLQGGIVSAYYLGTLVGALFGGWIGEKIGRIRTIAIGAAWGVLGASLQCSSQNHNWYNSLFTASYVPLLEVESAKVVEDILLTLVQDDMCQSHQWLRYRHTKRNRACLGY